MTLTVGDAAWLMSTLSDNTATNLLLDRIIVRRVWQKMEALGLPRTKSHSKIGYRISSVAVDSSVKYGHRRDHARRERAAVRAARQRPGGEPGGRLRDALHPRAQQGRGDARPYRGDARLAHKSGAVDRARNDCGLFYLQSRVIACVLTKENADTSYALDADPHLTIARMGAAVVRAWPPAPPPPAAAP
jgi:beta-lactamase class A